MSDLTPIVSAEPVSPDAIDFTLRLQGEAARAFSPVLTQALTGLQAMSETAAQLREAMRANTEATASLRQAFDTFRQQQQTRLDEALTRVQTEVAARVQAETDRDAISASLAEIRSAVEADTAQETELLNAMTAGAQAAPAPAPATPVAETPVAATPVPTDATVVPATDATAAPVTVTDPAAVPAATDPGTGAPVADPAAAPADATPATNGIGASFVPPQG